MLEVTVGLPRVRYPLDVKEGAQLFDRLVPGWEKVIDVSQLDMGDVRKCILGQLAYAIHPLSVLSYRFFREAVDMNLDKELWEHSEWQTPFCCAPGTYLDRERDPVRLQWIAEINARRIGE